MAVDAQEARGVNALPEAAGADASEGATVSRSFGQFLRAAPQNTWKAARHAASRSVAYLESLIELADRPFAGVSKSTKAQLGYIGMVTLVIAAASFLLPVLLAHNPYAGIE